LSSVHVTFGKKPLKTNATRILVDTGRCHVRSERVAKRELILDVGLFKQLLEGLVRAPVRNRHAGAVLPDQVVALVSCQVIRIGSDQRIKRIVHRIGSDRYRRQREGNQHTTCPHLHLSSRESEIEPATRTKPSPSS